MDHLARLKSGIANWNQWREKHPKESCDLVGQDLSGGYFFEGNFQGVSFKGAILKRACFIGADLREADLSHADLRGAYLGDANLRGADLSHANCEGTNLARVDLQHTNLQGTRFSSANSSLAQEGTLAASHQREQHSTKSQTKAQTAVALETHEPAQAIAQRSAPQSRGARLNLSPVAWAGAIAAGLAVVIGLPLAFTQQNTQNNIAQNDTGTEPQPVAQSELVEDTQPVTQLELTQFLDSAGQVWAVTTHTESDGDARVIGGGKDGLIEIWDRQTGKMVRTLAGHTDTVRSLAIAESGQRLVSGSGDGIKVWQPETGELIYSIPTGQNGGPTFMRSPVWSVAISPDEKTFVSSDYDGYIAVWDLASGEMRYDIHTDSTVWSVAIAPDGQSFVSGSTDGIVRQWDLQSGQLLQTFTGHRDAVRAVAIAPDGKTLASGSWDGSIKLWDLATGELQTTLNGHDGRVVSIAISPDGNTLASGSTDNTLKLWDLPSGTLTKNLDNNSNWVLAVAFALEEEMLVSGGKDRTIKVWQ